MTVYQEDASEFQVQNRRRYRAICTNITFFLIYPNFHGRNFYASEICIYENFVVSLYRQTKTNIIMTILNPSENEIKLACHDAIINCVARMTDVEGRDNDNFYTLYCDGVEMLWTDYVTYTLKNPVFVSGIGYITDIFLFGDGTLEFLRAYDDEPMCWDELSASGLSEVSKYVTKEFSDYLLKNIN